MTVPERPPKDNIVRALFPGAEVRDSESGTGTLFGHFAKFNEWTRISSHFEGTFMERIAPGAFAKTLEESRGRVRITLNHGQDPELGDKPIAAPEVMREDDQGAYYEAALLDGVPPLVVSGLRSGQYGSSFRFRVTREDLDRKAKASDHNPDALPERTIRELELYEFGPVTYPAYAGATAGVRSLTDDYIRHVIPEAPSVDAGASPHLEPERREDPDPPPPDAAPAQDPPEGGSLDSEEHSVTIEYVTREDKVSRATELESAIKRQAEETTGVLSVEAQARWDADNKELDNLKADIAAWDSRQARLASIVGTTGEVPSYQPPAVNQINRKAERDIYSPESRANNWDDRMQEYRDDAMRVAEIASFPYGLADEARTRDRIADLLDNHDSPDKEFARRLKYTGSPLYMRAFEKIIKAKGETFGLTPEEQRGTALAVGVDATGGFTVPFAFDPTVIAIGVNNGAVNPYRASCRVVSIVGTDTWNALTATAVVATRTTEAAAAIEQGPTFAQPQYIVTRVQGQITASFEMFQDRTDLASEMAVLIQEAKDNEEETSMAVGATAAANIGVGPVSGTSGAYTAVAGAGSGVLAEGDFTATEAALPVRHRFNAQWFMNRVNIRKAQSLETTGGKLFGGSQYPSVGNVALSGVGNTGLRLLGYPVNESPSLPTATTTTITAATLANVSSYVIVDRIGMSVQFIPFIFNSSALATGQQALYFMYRNTAKPINVDAGRTLRFL